MEPVKVPGGLVSGAPVGSQFPMGGCGWERLGHWQLTMQGIIKSCMFNRVSDPRDPSSPPENGFMEAKLLCVSKGIKHLQSVSESMTIDG